jgi:hypothetical protein
LLVDFFDDDEEEAEPVVDADFRFDVVAALSSPYGDPSTAGGAHAFVAPTRKPALRSIRTMP